MARRLKWRNIILLLLLLTTVVIAIVLSVTTWGESEERTVQNIAVIVADKEERMFVNPEVIEKQLRNPKTGIVGKKLKDINTKTIEKNIGKDPVIRKVECYKTAAGNIAVKVWQRKPLLRVMEEDGKSYYMDNEGQVFPTSTRHSAHVVVVTGETNKRITGKEILPLVKLIEKDDFWKSNIQEIHRTKSGDLVLTPAVGDHVILLGKAEKLDTKLRRLKTFYKNGLCKIGWGDYESISAEFDNQIVCEKKRE